jgi:hypothetical protein
MRLQVVFLVVIGLLVGGGASAQQPRADARPTPPPWTPVPNPHEPVCVLSPEGGRGRASPVVMFENRDGKVVLVVQSRPSETVAVVIHENGAVSFDRPVCFAGIDAVVTRPVATN